MKRTTTKTEITVETRQRITLRGRGQRVIWGRAVWCNNCAATVGMYLPEHAAVLSRTTSREIYRRVENGDLHFVETTEGELFICCNSLAPDYINKPRLERQQK
jgi:hypothetical protein